MESSEIKVFDKWQSRQASPKRIATFELITLYQMYSTC